MLYRSMLRSVLAAGLITIFCGAMATAGERFPFVVPGDDASASATDMSYLSPKPAGADGFVHIADGHMVTDAGRLRIWGVNLCFGADFPQHDEAEKVAAHLAKLGVNGVRIHHHDTAPAPRGILGKVVDGHRVLEPEQFDRQDYFLDQLHKHGVYANLNMHVGRAFTGAEGIDTSELGQSFHYSKYVIYFEPRMRAKLKEFIREYMGHVNPYRKLKRSEDPGIAMVEITNENSFSKFGPGPAAAMPEPYRGEFVRQWNQWLGNKYKSNDEIKKAWGANAEPLGQTLADSSAWKQSAGEWRLHQSTANPVHLQFGQGGPQGDMPSLRLEIPSKAPAIHLQELSYPNLPVEAGRIYTISFWVKADKARTLHADISNQGPDEWGSAGFLEMLNIGPQWQKVHRVFRANAKIPGKVRICFKFGGQDVSFNLAGVSLRQGGDWIVLPEGQSLEKHNIDIPLAGWSEPAQADVKRFMVDTEKEFIRDLRDFLKKDVGVRVPITASQITYASPEIVADACDYADIHAYWQHPHFPHKPWDSKDWTIRNIPMEASPDGDALLSRAPWRLLDRPFTISEWNIPDPNDYAASVVPFAAMVAALQDWDGVFFFDYHSSEQNWYTNKLQGYFSFNGQPAKLALLSACAAMYRRGDLAALPKTAAGTLTDMVPTALAMTYRVGIDPKATAPTKITAEGRRLASEDARAVWDATNREQACVSVNAPASRAVWGLIAGRSFDLAGVKFSVGAVERNYAVLVITTLDGKAVESSKRLLLTAAGSAENIGMDWNATRTSVGNKWGNGPSQVNGIAAEVELPLAAAHVYAMDGRGQRVGEVAITASGKTTRFSIGPKQRTLWYEVEAK